MCQYIISSVLNSFCEVNFCKTLLDFALETLIRNNAFSQYELYGQIFNLHKNPCTWGHEIYNFGRPFLCYDYYIFSLFDLCLGVKKIFKEIMHFHYTCMTYMATPQHKNPCTRGHESYSFGRPFLGHDYYILSLSDLCLGVEKKIFKKNYAFSPYDLYGHTLAQEPMAQG